MILWGLEGIFKSSLKFIEQFLIFIFCVYKIYYLDNVDISNKVGQIEYKREIRDKDM